MVFLPKANIPRCRDPPYTTLTTIFVLVERTAHHGDVVLKLHKNILQIPNTRGVITGDFDFRMMAVVHTKGIGTK